MQSFKSSPTAPLVSNFPLHSSYPPVPSPSAPLQLLSRQFLYPPLHVPLLQPPVIQYTPSNLPPQVPFSHFSSSSAHLPFPLPFYHHSPLPFLPFPYSYTALLQLHSAPDPSLVPTSSLHLQLPCQ